MKIKAACVPIDDHMPVEEERAEFGHGNGDTDTDRLWHRTVADVQAWLQDQVGEAVYSEFQVTYRVEL